MKKLIALIVVAGSLGIGSAAGATTQVPRPFMASEAPRPFVASSKPRPFMTSSISFRWHRW